MLGTPLPKMGVEQAFEQIHEFYNSLLFYVVPVYIARGRPLGILEFAPGILDWSMGQFPFNVMGFQ